MMDKSSSEAEQLEWHRIGTVEELALQQCRKIYMGTMRLALFHVSPDKFFLTNATCPHARGPLDQGDIEELNGIYKVVCPLHYYSFNMVTGESSTGLKLKTYKTEVRDQEVYGLTPEPLSMIR